MRSSVALYASPDPTPSFIAFSVFLRRARVVPRRIASMWREASRNLGLNMSAMNLGQRCL